MHKTDHCHMLFGFSYVFPCRARHRITILMPSLITHHHCWRHWSQISHPMGRVTNDVQKRLTSLSMYSHKWRHRSHVPTADVTNHTHIMMTSQITYPNGWPHRTHTDDVTDACNMPTRFTSQITCPHCWCWRNTGWRKNPDWRCWWRLISRMLDQLISLYRWFRNSALFSTMACVTTCKIHTTWHRKE